MKATGIVRRIDELGRIVVPKELRRTLDIAEGDPIEIFVVGREIVLKKYAPGCTFCGSVDNVKSFRDKLVCSECAKAVGR